MNQRKLNRILKAHSTWVLHYTAGKPAIFIDEDLSGLTFGEDILTLEYIIFRNCDLSNTCFECQDIKHAFFDRCNLSHANFMYSDLRGSFFHQCNLDTTNFSNAYLSNSIIDEWREVENDNIRNTDFTDTRLSPTFCNKRLLDLAYPTIVPTHGAFVGWKKCITNDVDEVIVKLLIPEDAKRCGGIIRQCRADKAIVLDIQDIDGNSLPDTIAYSIYDFTFEYKIGETVTADNYTPDPHEACVSGIHFFITRHEAVNY